LNILVRYNTFFADSSNREV